MCISLVINGLEHFLILAHLIHFVYCQSLVHPVFSSPESFKLWTNHPVFGMAKITFSLALLLGFIFTIWLHLPYISGLQRAPYFGSIGVFLSFCEGAP